MENQYENRYETHYHFLMDLRDYIREGRSKEILHDLRVYFPEQYEEFYSQFKKESVSKEIAALLRTYPVRAYPG